VSEIVRFSVSIEAELLEQFDRYCQQYQFATRSEAVRQAIREMLTRSTWEVGSGRVVGTLTLVYDHHRAQIRDRLLELQHSHTDLIVCVLHVHLSHDLCLEILVLRGAAERLGNIAAQLRGMKGVYKGDLVIAGTEEGEVIPIAGGKTRLTKHNPGS